MKKNKKLNKKKTKNGNNKKKKKANKNTNLNNNFDFTDKYNIINKSTFIKDDININNKNPENFSKIYTEGDIKDIYENINLYINDLDEYFFNDDNENNEKKTIFDEN